MSTASRNSLKTQNTGSHGSRSPSRDRSQGIFLIINLLFLGILSSSTAVSRTTIIILMPMSLTPISRPGIRWSRLAMSPSQETTTRSVRLMIAPSLSSEDSLRDQESMSATSARKMDRLFNGNKLERRAKRSHVSELPTPQSFSMASATFSEDRTTRTINWTISGSWTSPLSNIQLLTYQEAPTNHPLEVATVPIFTMVKCIFLEVFLSSPRSLMSYSFSISRRDLSQSVEEAPKLIQIRMDNLKLKWEKKITPQESRREV